MTKVSKCSNEIAKRKETIKATERERHLRYKKQEEEREVRYKYT